MQELSLSLKNEWKIQPKLHPKTRLSLTKKINRFANFFEAQHFLTIEKSDDETKFKVNQFNEMLENWIFIYSPPKQLSSYMKVQYKTTGPDDNHNKVLKDPSKKH